MKKAKKGNKVTGNKKKNLLKNILAAVLLFCVVILIIAIPEDNGSKFWSENELRITRQFNIILDNEKTQTVLNQEKEIIGEASEDVRKKVEELKSNIIEFFNSEYNIDVTDSINNIENIYIFEQDLYKEQFLGGYIDSKDIIYLNEEILDKGNMMESIIVHEIMHYLRFKSKSTYGIYFIEGLTEAITHKCLDFVEKEFYFSNFYGLAHNLSMQILAVDKDIVKKVLTEDDFDIMQRINLHLKDVKQSIIKIDDIATNLECCITSIFYVNIYGSKYQESDLEAFILQAQDIVSSYCKTFNPTKKQIKEIRKYYIIQDYEKLKIVVEGNTTYVTIE